VKCLAINEIREEKKSSAKPKPERAKEQTAREEKIKRPSCGQKRTIDRRGGQKGEVPKRRGSIDKKNPRKPQRKDEVDPQKKTWRQTKKSHLKTCPEENKRNSPQGA